MAGWEITSELVQFWPNKDEGERACCDDRVVTYGGSDLDDEGIGWLDDTDVDVEGWVTNEVAGWGITPELVGVWQNKDDGESACCDDGVVTYGSNNLDDEGIGWLDDTDFDVEG